MKKLSILIACLIFTGISVQAQTYMTESGTATFYSDVPLHTFSGSSDYLVGQVNLESKIVDFYIDLTTLDTGIEKRDRDMLETLETDKFPFAEFYGELQSDFDPDVSGPQEAVVEGTFKIHGVERETNYTGTLEMTPDGLLLKASWVLLLEDYDIVPPSLLFIKVDQEQKIEIEALLKPVQD